MSGKSGQRGTGNKPTTVRRKSSKTDGASGKETGDQVTAGRNVDKGARKTRTSGGSSS